MDSIRNSCDVFITFLHKDTDIDSFFQILQRSPPNPHQITQTGVPVIQQISIEVHSDILVKFDFFICQIPHFSILTIYLLFRPTHVTHCFPAPPPLLVNENTFYIQSIHIPPFPFMFFSHLPPLQFSFSWPFSQGWRHKPKPSSQRNGQVLHETYFHITITAVKILIMIMSVSMISAGFYEDDNDHIHLSILTSSSS